MHLSVFYIRTINIIIYNNMSAMQGVSKKQKTAPRANVTGAGVVIRSLVRLDMSSQANGVLPKLWVQDDDRTDWTPDFPKAAYGADFVNSDHPYNVYTVSLDSEKNYEPLYIPVSAMKKDGEAKTDGTTTHTFTKAEHGRAMLFHCLTKMWVPNFVFPLDFANGLYYELQAMTLKDTDGRPLLDKRGNPKYDSNKIKQKLKEITISDEQAEAFVDRQLHWTKICQFKTGIVRGGIKSDSTNIETAKAECFEEARVPMEILELQDRLRPCGTVSHGSNAIACYELLIGEDEMLRYWQEEGVRRDEISNYKCPHGFAQYLPGIDLKEFGKVKDERETSNGRWVTGQYTTEKDKGNVISKVVEDTILEKAAVNILTQVLNYNN